MIGAPRRQMIFGLYVVVLMVCVVGAIGLLFVGSSTKTGSAEATLPAAAPAGAVSPVAPAAPKTAASKPAAGTTAAGKTAAGKTAAGKTAAGATPAGTSAPATAKAPTAAPAVTAPATTVPVTVFLQVDPESGKGCTAGITSGNRWIKYKVQPGDTLTAIARCFDLNGYQAVYQQNEKLIGDNPNLIFPGQVFTIVNGVMTASEPSA